MTSEPEKTVEGGRERGSCRSSSAVDEPSSVPPEPPSPSPESTDGDPEIESLLVAELPQLQAYVRLRLGPQLAQHESVEDLVQSVCREVLKRRDGFSYEHSGGFKAWLYQFVIHKVREKLRYHAAHKRDPRRLASEPAEHLARSYATLLTASQIVMAREEMQALERALARLPEAQRNLLLEARLLGRSAANIAEQEGKTPEAVRQALHRATLKLMGYYEQERA